MTLPCDRNACCLMGDFMGSRSPFHRPTTPRLNKISLALYAPEYQRDSSKEFELARAKLNKIIATSQCVGRLLVWDGQQQLTSSPFHHTVRSLQKYNVHGLFILLRFSGTQRELLESLRKVCGYLWTRRIYDVEEGCPPVPLAVVVCGPDGKRRDKDCLKRKMLTLLEASAPPALITLDLVTVRFVWTLEEADHTMADTANWLKRAAKWYQQRRVDRPLWENLDWEKVFRREVKAAWKSVARKLADPLTSRGTLLKRSQSEPMITPRRKPIISDEILLNYGEEAAGIAAQLKHFSKPTGIWKTQHPRTEYLHAVFQELVAIRESVRVKLIRRKQYFQKAGIAIKQEKGGVDRFYTRFQWIKSYSGDKTSQLIIYFSYGNVVQYSIARMRDPLSPCDIQILRAQLLVHSDLRRHRVTSARAKTLCDLWTKTQSEDDSP